MNAGLTTARYEPVDGGNGTPGPDAPVRRSRLLLQALPSLLLFGLPMLAIVAVSSGAVAHGLGHQFPLHEIMVAAATILGGLFTFIAYRGYLADHSGFRYYLALAFLAETLLYALHGVFTRWSHTDPLLFLLFGPASRLAFAALLLAAIFSLRSGAKLAAEKARLGPWVFAIVALAFAIAGFALLGGQDKLPVSMRVVLELIAFLVLVVAGSALLQTNWWVASAIVRSLAAALILFIMASLAFLMVKTAWDPMFWLAHGIFASGFLILGVGVLRARSQVASMDDVFDLEVLAMRLRQRETALAHRESLQRIAGGIAHHINNLMTVVIGNAESLAESSAGRPREQSMAENCLRAGERVAQLSRRLAVCAGQAPMAPTPLPLNHLLDTIARRWRDERGQDASLETVHGAAGTQVNADLELMCEAVRELLHNGLDSLQGTGRLTLTSVSGDGGPGPNFVGIAVVDRGQGMSEGVLERAREPFFSTGNLSVRSGLGLSFAEGVAESLGGSVTLKSRLGVGTTATIWLRLAQ